MGYPEKFCAPAMWHRWLQNVTSWRHLKLWRHVASWYHVTLGGHVTSWRNLAWPYHVTLWLLYIFSKNLPCAPIGLLPVPLKGGKQRSAPSFGERFFPLLLWAYKCEALRTPWKVPKEQTTVFVSSGRSFVLARRSYTWRGERFFRLFPSLRWGDAGLL